MGHQQGNSSDHSDAAWADLITPDEWRVYKSALDSVRQAGARFMLGGAFGLAVYTNRWRDTKDLDLLVLPADREKIVKALTDSGFADLHERQPYDRGWIYRSIRDEFIVDVIWQMANRRAQVDENWFAHATRFELHSQELEIVPPEELLWHKLYVLQRERCDWPDVLNLLRTTSAKLDWKRLLERVGADAPLLAALLQVFIWLCPGRAKEIPPWVHQKLGLPAPNGSILEDKERISLLDTRPWFGSPPQMAKSTTKNEEGK